MSDQFTQTIQAVAPSAPVVKVSLPIASAAVVGMLIAKYGFHVSIPLLWVFAPWWVPIAFGATILGVIIVGLALLAGGAMLVAAAGDAVRLHKLRQRQAAFDQVIAAANKNNA